MSTPASDFDAAKAIAEQLKGMEKERQQRVLRWVAESLNLDVRGSPQMFRAAGREEGAGVQVPDHSVAKTEHRALDIKTFVDSKKPKSDVQFAVVVAYYYRFVAPPTDRKETIDAKALQDAARLAGRRRLPEPLMTLNNAKKLGYLDAPSRGQFQLNTVGENLVAMTLPGGEGESRSKGGRRKADKRKGKRAKR